MRKVLSLAVSAVALLMLPVSQMSCSDKVAGPDTKDGIPLIAVAATDYQTAGNFEIILADYTVKPNLLPGLHTDLAVRARGRYVYILESMGKDKVTKYDSKGGKTVLEEPLGAGLNIQDIAVVSDTKAYISSYQTSDLIVFNPATGKEASKISLAEFNTYAGTDSAEATPYASALAVYDGYVYVACQRLKNFEPADTSLIVVIDSRTNTVSRSIKLNKKNPSSLDVFQGRLLVSSPGDWFDASTGGVEAIDLTSNTNQGVKFDGIVTAIVSVSLDKAYIGVMGADWNTEIVPFDPTAGTAGAKVDGITDGSGGLAYDGSSSRLYVGERGFGTTTGVAVVNPATNTVERTIPTSLPPTSIAVIFAD